MIPAARKMQPPITSGPATLFTHPVKAQGVSLKRGNFSITDLVHAWLVGAGAERATRWLFAIAGAAFLMCLGSQCAIREHRNHPIGAAHVER